MNNKKRYLILDSGNRAQCPKAHGYSGPDVQSDGSPSFLVEQSAKDFGGWLAKRHSGQRFYLATVTAAVVAYTKPDPDAPPFIATE